MVFIITNNRTETTLDCLGINFVFQNLNFVLFLAGRILTVALMLLQCASVVCLSSVCTECIVATVRPRANVTIDSLQEVVYEKSIGTKNESP